MHHGLSIEHTRIDLLHLRILGDMLHDALMLLFDHGGALRPSYQGVLDDRLPLQLFRPGGQLMRHRRLLGRRMARMWLAFSRHGQRRQAAPTGYAPGTRLTG